MTQVPDEQSSLSQWLNYLASIHVSAIDMGLERVRPVFDALNLPRPDLVISVAGTNGKGSTSAAIAYLLGAHYRERGKDDRVALYQSPHLIDFCERIVIDGQKIDELALIDAFQAVERTRVACGVSLSFFEITTLAAFYIFAKQQCTAWVLEVGLGGRLDVVNLMDADVAVITSIGIDHTEWLGDDIEQIGHEKAGIMREGARAVLGADMPKSVLDSAKNLGVTAWQADTDFSHSVIDGVFYYSNPFATLPLSMPHIAPSNMALAMSALTLSGVDILPIADSACQNVRLAGRFDVRQINGVQHIFDVAHNAAGAAFLLERFEPLWREYAKHHASARLFVVFSMLADKDIDTVLQQFCARDLKAVWRVGVLDSPRARGGDDLKAAFLRHGIAISVYDTLPKAYDSIEARADDWVLVFGSFYAVGEILTHTHH